MKNLIKIAHQAKEPLSENPARTLQSGKGVVTGTPRQPLMSSLFNLPTKLAAILCLLLTLGIGNAWADTHTLGWGTASGSSGTYTNFTATSGTVTDIVSFTTAKNSSGSNPAYNSSSNELRLYYASNGSGGSITLTPASGVTITGFTITTSTAPTTKYKVGNGSLNTITLSSNTGSVTGLSVGSSSSITIQNCNTSNTQLRIKTIQITYTASAASHTLSSSVSPAASGSVSLSATSVTEGSTATATATPATHYVFDQWSISGTGSTLSSTTTNPTTVTMGTANTTVTATFTAVPKASITLSEAGATTTDASTYYVGDSYTLPSSTEASCGSKVLVGWSTGEVAETNTKPTSNFYEKGETVTLAASQTFYAVFATASGGGTATWTSTTLASLTGSDIFVISNGSYAMTNNNGTSSAPAVASITVSNGKITSTVNDNMKWNISGNSTDGYVFYPNGSTTTWLYCNTTASSSSNNNIRVGTGDRKLWVPDNNGYLVTNDSYTDRYLSIYSSQDFRGYTGTSNGAFVPQIFKYSAGTTYSAYSTTCCTPLGSINGSVSWSNPTTAVVTWNKLADQVSAWALSWSPNTTGSSITSAIADLGETQKTATVSGLACGTEYTFTFTPTLKSGVCALASNPTVVETSTKYSITLTSGGVKTEGVFTADVDASADDEHACDGVLIELEAAADDGYEFDHWAITHTSGGANAWSDVQNTGDADEDDIIIEMPTYDITVNAVFACVTPSFTVHPASKTDYLTTDSPTALEYTASAAGASLTQQWQVSTDNENWDNIGGATSATYTPDVSTAGTKYYRVVVTNSAAGCSSATATSDPATITSTAPSGYCISIWNSSNNGIQSGFSNGGSGNHYTMSFTVPGKDGSNNWPEYWIGENNSYQSFSVGATLADMPLLSATSATLGLAEGATGTLHIWDDNKASGSNLWVKFDPSGYGLRWGGADWSQAENTKAFTVDAGDANVYWTDIVTLDGTNNTTWNYYVGLQTASGYVYSGVDNEASDIRGLSRTRSVTTMKVSNGTAGSYKGTYLNSEATGTRGKFRIWNNNTTDYNFVCHFVPFYRVTYDGSGASGSTAASADVCCEGNQAARTVQAAANGFTVPTGKSFGGWASSPENAAAGTVAYAAGADVVLTGSITLYAIWTDVNYTVTVNQSPAAGATTTGQTSTAHYNGTINLTTTIPDGYRFVNWTTSDGFSITNSTSATTASFTMPAKNVTVTANFQQTHTVDWYVGGSAPANKIGNDGQTTVVDHGGKISDFPATTPDGSACEKTFVGWTNTSSYVHGTSPLFNDVAGSPTINADASFYAVFAEVNSVSASLTKMTADDDLEVGDKIVIIAQDTRYGMYQASASSYVSYWTTTDMDGEPSLSEIEADDKKYLDVAAGSASNTWKLGDATNGYLYNASSTNLEFSTTNSSDLTLITWTDDSFTLQAGQYISCRTDITGANANKWRGAGASCDPENDNNCSGTEYYYLYKYVPGGTTYTGHTINCADCGSSVTPTYTASPTGGTVSVTKSATPVASGSTVKTCTAVDLTVTLTPATHYTLTGFTATGLTTGAATISPAVNTVVPTTSAQTFTVTVSAGATGTLNLTPTFTPETPLTITLNTNNKGTFTPIGDVYSGDSFTFPTVTPADPECASFLGWIEGTTFVGDGTTTDPATVTGLATYHAAGSSSGALTTNMTYTAVFGEKDTRDAPAYEKVTAAPTPPATWDGDHYLIVYEGDLTHDAVAFDGRRDNDAESYGNIDATNNGVAVTISDSKIAKTDRLAAAEWKIASITGGYSIQSASGFYIGRAANSNGLDTDGSTAKVNTLAYSSSSFSVTGAGGKVLKYNYAADQLRFRYLTNGQDIQLYKLNASAQVVTYTYTTDPACTPRYRVMVNDATGGSPSSDKTYEHAGETITLTANPSAGYSFTGWAMENTSTHADASSLLSSTTTETATFTMPAYDVTVTASYAKKVVTSLQVKDGETVIANSGTLNISTGANKTLTVVVTPADAYDHSWTATVTAGGTFASITNVADGSFRVNALAQGDATITVNAPNDGDAKTVTFTVHVTDILPEEIILKRDGSSAEIESLTMYYDAANSKGQYVKVNVSYSPTPTNPRFNTTNNMPTKTATIDAPVAGYTTIHANGLTGETPATITFTSEAVGSVTKVLTVTILPLLADQFVDYIHGNATQSVSARLSADRYDIITDINTPSLTDTSDSDPTSEDCETAHYHLIGWLPQATAEALWAAGTTITEATEGLVKAGAHVEATGQTWYAIWGKEQ